MPLDHPPYHLIAPLHPPASAPLTFKQEILDCQVRVGCGLIVIDIVGICDVVCPVMVVIFVLYRTVIMYVVINMYIFVMVMK